MNDIEESVVEQTKKTRNACDMSQYMIKVLKNSDEIAKKMLFHDMIYFKLAQRGKSHAEGNVADYNMKS